MCPHSGGATVFQICDEVEKNSCVLLAVERIGARGNVVKVKNVLLLRAPVCWISLFDNAARGRAGGEPGQTALLTFRFLILTKRFAKLF